MQYKGNEKEYMRQYYLANKDKFKAYHKKKAAKYPEREAEYKRKWRERNRERHNAYNKAWAKENSGKVTAYAREYQALKLNRMPKWLTAEQINAIKKVYENRPKGYHVDHIIPLKGKNVSGLHVPWNLQYLPAKDNLKKSNKLK